MVYHICQIWDDNSRLVIAVFKSRDAVDDFLLRAQADGRLRLWGEVKIIGIEGVVSYSPAQWLRSRRVYETIDGLSSGRQRPGYGNEYARSLYELNPENWEPLMSYHDPVPNTLETGELPQDHIDPPAGPNWRLRENIRPWRESEHEAEQREAPAARRLALATADDIRLQKAVASLAAQLAKPQPEAAPTPAPAVEDLLHELTLEQENDFPIRPVEQRARRSLNRDIEDLPPGAYVDLTQ